MRPFTKRVWYGCGEELAEELELAKLQERSTCAAARISADQQGKRYFTTSIKVAEFYAGIGGFHYAFLESDLSKWEK